MKRNLQNEINQLLSDLYETWQIISILGTDDPVVSGFIKRHPYFSWDLRYNYILLYCLKICRLFDPEEQHGHGNFCFPYVISLMKNGKRKDLAIDLQNRIIRKIKPYRDVRNKIGAHICRQTHHSRSVIPINGAGKAEEIQNDICKLYEIIFNGIYGSPPIEAKNDFYAIMSRCIKKCPTNPLNRSA